jgi:hypothetical protein
MYRNLYYGEVSALNFTLSLWRGAGSTSQASLEAWGALAELLSPPGLIPEYGTENSPEEAREITVIVVYWLDMWTGSRSKKIIFRVTFGHDPKREEIARGTKSANQHELLCMYVFLALHPYDA